MLDVMLSLLSYQAAMYLNRGVVPTRLGSAHEYHVPGRRSRRGTATS